PFLFDPVVLGLQAGQGFVDGLLELPDPLLFLEQGLTFGCPLPLGGMKLIPLPGGLLGQGFDLAQELAAVVEELAQGLGLVWHGGITPKAPAPGACRRKSIGRSPASPRVLPA